MSAYADEGTAAHWVLSDCLDRIYTFGIPTSAREYVGLQIKIEDYEHGLLSPSGSDRWMQCFGSVQMSRASQERQLGGPRTVVFTKEYAVAVQEVLDYVTSRVLEISEHAHRPVLVYTECKVSPFRYLGTHDCDGTVDILLMPAVREDIGTSMELVADMELIDAKFGANHPVMPSSRQLHLYLLGALSEYHDMSFETARLTVAQPRCGKVQPSIRSEDIQISEWRDSFVAECLNAIEATKQEPPILKPSEEACRFCPARGQCSAATRHVLTQATVLDEQAPVPATADNLYADLEKFANLDPFRLTPGQMRAIIDSADFLEATIRAVKSHALELLKNNKAPSEIRGAYKLVRVNGRRRWTYDAKEIEKRLKKISVFDPEAEKTRKLGRKDLTETTIKSVAQVERMLAHHFGVPKKDARFDAFQALVTKPEGALVLAPLSDQRPAARLNEDPQHALGAGPDIPSP